MNTIEQNVTNNFASPLAATSKNSISADSDIGKSKNVSGEAETKKDEFILSNDFSNNTGIYSLESVSSNSAVTYSSTSTAPRIDCIAYSLAAKRAGLSVNSGGMPIINNASQASAYNAQLNAIRNVSAKIPYQSSYCYSQTGNSYGFSYPKRRCAAYALATAISIRDKNLVTPDKLVTDDGIVDWGKNNAYKVDASESETFLAINAQLSMGNPVLIHATGKDNNGNDSEHWATVISRQNGKYRIIDPYYGKECDLDQMQIYKNGGQIVGYAVISEKY